MQLGGSTTTAVACPLQQNRLQLCVLTGTGERCKATFCCTSFRMLPIPRRLSLDMHLGSCAIVSCLTCTSEHYRAQCKATFSFTAVDSMHPHTLASTVERASQVFPLPGPLGPALCMSTASSCHNFPGCKRPAFSVSVAESCYELEA